MKEEIKPCPFCGATDAEWAWFGQTTTAAKLYVVDSVEQQGRSA